MISPATKIRIHKILAQFGVDVRRINPQTSGGAALFQMLKSHGVNCVIDVGANEGQYAAGLREIGYKGRIISVEPLTDAYARLCKASAHDSGWTVIPRTAIGDRDGSIVINIAANSGASSSALPMSDTLLDAAPEIAYIGSETVPIAKLDSIHPGWGLEDVEKTFLKIDVQGFESQVLAGAATLLSNIRGVQIELSLLPLYRGQVLALPIIQDLIAAGFELWHLMPEFVDQKSGRLLQFDAIFFRGPVELP